MRSYLAVALEPNATRSQPPGGTSRLLQLQELDLSRDRLRARLAVFQGQEDVRQARARSAQAEAMVGEVKLALDEAARQQRKLEGDLDGLTRKAEAERRRLYDGSVANPKELQSIEHEVQSLRARIGRVEDLLLEQMQLREDLEARLRARSDEAEEVTRRQAEVEETSARELVEVEAALGERNAERAALVREIDEDLLSLYEDLRRQKKGIGAAALVDGVCQGCHQKLSPVYLDRLKRSEGIRRCEYCRRILVPQ